MSARGRAAGLAMKRMQRYHWDNVTRTLHTLMRGVEAMKARGMPGNEAARLNQYLWLLQVTQAAPNHDARRRCRRYNRRVAIIPPPTRRGTASGFYTPQERVCSQRMMRVV